MSNVSVMFDKYKTCKNCPDRSIDPPCHETCEGYKARCQEQKRINDNRRASQKVPTEHHIKSGINYYKRKKKFRNL